MKKISILPIISIFAVLMITSCSDSADSEKEVMAAETFSISYDLGTDHASASVPSDSNRYLYGQKVRLPDSIKDKDSKIFKWTDGEKSYYPGALYSMPSSNAVLKAVWKQMNTVSYNYGVVTSIEPPATVGYEKFDKYTIADAPTNVTGYVFKEWQIDGNKVEAGALRTFEGESIEITAIWNGPYYAAVPYNVLPKHNCSYDSCKDCINFDFDQQLYFGGNYSWSIDMPDQAVYYTKDGSDPVDETNPARIKYTGPFELGKNDCTIKWYAAAALKFNSTTQSQPYRVNTYICDNCKAIYYKNNDRLSCSKQEGCPLYGGSYHFTDVVRRCDVENVYYGDWPQTLKSDDITVDKTQSISKGIYTYYAGSDGFWYAELNSNFYRVEPIKWHVVKRNVKDNYAWVITRDAIISGIPYVKDASKRTIDGNSIYGGNWKYSTARQFLNGINEDGDSLNEEYNENGFYQTAFSGDCESLIYNTETDGVNNRIFLASKSELDDYLGYNNFEDLRNNFGYNIHYNAKKNIRNRIPTAFALACGASTPEGYNTVYWYLRTNSGSQVYVMYAKSDTPAYESTTTDASRGLVPAMLIKLPEN